MTSQILTKYILASIKTRMLIFLCFYFIIIQLHYINNPFVDTFAFCNPSGEERLDSARLSQMIEHKNMFEHWQVTGKKNTHVREINTKLMSDFIAESQSKVSSLNSKLKNTTETVHTLQKQTSELVSEVNNKKQTIAQLADQVTNLNTNLERTRKYEMLFEEAKKLNVFDRSFNERKGTINPIIPHVIIPKASAAPTIVSGLESTNSLPEKGRNINVFATDLLVKSMLKQTNTDHNVRDTLENARFDFFERCFNLEKHVNRRLVIQEFRVKTLNVSANDIVLRQILNMRQEIADLRALLAPAPVVNEENVTTVPPEMERPNRGTNPEDTSLNP
jgi:uncharacterized protein YoxC